MHGKIVAEVTDIESAYKAVTSITGCVSGSTLAARPYHHIFVQFSSDDTITISLLGCSADEMSGLLDVLRGVLVLSVQPS